MTAATMLDSSIEEDSVFSWNTLLEVDAPFVTLNDFFCNEVEDDEDGALKRRRRPQRQRQLEEEEDEQLAAMLHMERGYCQEEDAQQGEPAAAVLPPRVEWGSKICEWYYRVVDQYSYDREAVAVALNLFDRYLVALKERRRYMSSLDSQGKEDELVAKEQQEQQLLEDEDECIDPFTYQLSATACLYLSVKTRSPVQEEAAHAPIDNPASCSGAHHAPRSRTRRLKISHFASLSRGQFTTEDIAAVELDVLQTLQWRVNPPTAAEFAGRFLGVLRRGFSHTALGKTRRNSASHRETIADHVLFELSRYLIELSLHVPSMCSNVPGSASALAAVTLSSELLNEHCLPRFVRDEFAFKICKLSRGRLHIRSSEVARITESMRERFLPEMYRQARQDLRVNMNALRHLSLRHPLAVARDAGLLSAEQARECYPPPPPEPELLEDAQEHDECCSNENSEPTIKLNGIAKKHQLIKCADRPPRVRRARSATSVAERIYSPPSA